MALKAIITNYHYHLHHHRHCRRHHQHDGELLENLELALERVWLPGSTLENVQKLLQAGGERREQRAEGVIQKEGKDSCKDTLDPLGELQDPREKSCVTGAEEELLKIAPLLENVQKLLQAGGERGESRELK